MDKKEKWQKLKNKLKSAVFIEIMIWLLLIVSAFSIGYGVFYYKFIKPNLYTIQFHDIDGLINGSPVRFMGIVIGHVRNLDYNKDAIDVQIIVTKKGLKIPPGSVASVQFSGIAGSKSIEIMPPESDLSDIGIIAKETLRITDVLDAYEYIGKAFSSLKDFVDGINQDTVLKIFAAVSDTGEGIKKASENVENASKTQKNFEKKMDNVILEQKKLGATLDKVNENTKKLNSYLKN